MGSEKELVLALFRARKGYKKILKHLEIPLPTVKHNSEMEDRQKQKNKKKKQVKGGKKLSKSQKSKINSRSPKVLRYKWGKSLIQSIIGE